MENGISMMRLLQSICVMLLPISLAAAELKIKQGAEGLSVQRDGETILTQVARTDFRPYIHPIVAPDGKGELTEFSPAHHKHQTGLYWGFTSLNKRNHFTHSGKAYFKRQSLSVLTDKGATVSWKVVYDLLDGYGETTLRESKTWTLRDEGDHYVLDLLWSGLAKTDVTIGKSLFGGMFLRMPWKRGMPGVAINNKGEKNKSAEGKRADWVDVGMQVKGRNDLAHIVIMDHPDNPGYPTPWRVDNQLGVGPCYARLGDWQIPKGESVTFRHRLLIYTGDQNKKLIDELWTQHIESLPQKPTLTPTRTPTMPTR